MASNKRTTTTIAFSRTKKEYEEEANTARLAENNDTAGKRREREREETQRQQAFLLRFSQAILTPKPRPKGLVRMLLDAGRKQQAPFFKTNLRMPLT